MAVFKAKNAFFLKNTLGISEFTFGIVRTHSWVRDIQLFPVHFFPLYFLTFVFAATQIFLRAVHTAFNSSFTLHLKSVLISLFFSLAAVYIWKQRLITSSFRHKRSRFFQWAYLGTDGEHSERSKC